MVMVMVVYSTLIIFSFKFLLICPELGMGDRHCNKKSFTPSMLLLLQVLVETARSVFVKLFTCSDVAFCTENGIHQLIPITRC